MTTCVANTRESIILDVVDDYSSSAAEFAGEGCLKTMGMGCDFKALSSEQLDDICMSLELCVTKFWILVDLKKS